MAILIVHETTKRHVFHRAYRETAVMAPRARGRPMRAKNHIHTYQCTLRRDAKGFGMVPT